MGGLSYIIVKGSFSGKEHLMEREPNNKDSLEDSPPPDSSERGRRDSIRQYLLGELSEEEHEQIEKRLLSEDDYFEEILIAEEELTDDFVRDRLPDPDHAKFHRRFLSVPELRQDVRFAKALRKYTRQDARHALETAHTERPLLFRVRLVAFFQRPAIGLSLAAALLLAVFVVAWMVAQNRRLRAEVESLQARQPPPAPTPQTGLQEQLASERERADRLDAQLRREQELRAAERNLEETKRQQPPTSRRSQESVPVVVAVFTLTPGLVRDTGAGFPQIPLPSNGGRILLRLDLAADDYRTYRATLKTLEGRQLLSAANLRARASGPGKVVPFIVPTARLAQGNDYEILLSGKTTAGTYEGVGSYHFRVVK
jgi:hypothetical protein